MIAEPDSAEPAADSASTRVAVRVTGLRKHYGEVAAVHDLDLTVGAGEFFTLLGCT